MCVGTISEKDKGKHKSKYLELKSFSVVLGRQQRSVQWCGYLDLDNEPPSCLQHRRSGDQYKMQYIVSMFILIRSFNHQSSAQNAFTTATPISMIFILRRSVWWPRLLGGGMVEGGYLRWSPGVWRPEDGSQSATFPATCRDLPRLPQPAETSQPAQCRAAAVGPPPRGEWSADYHHQPAQPAANNSSPLPSHQSWPNIFENTQIFLIRMWNTQTLRSQSDSEILSFMKWNKIIFIVPSDMLNCCCMLNELLPT